MSPTAGREDARDEASFSTDLGYQLAAPAP